MVIDKIRKMSIKGVKLKSESFFSISPGVLELWRKNLRGGGGFRPPPVQIGLSQTLFWTGARGRIPITLNYLTASGSKIIVSKIIDVH